MSDSVDFTVPPCRAVDRRYDRYLDVQQVHQQRAAFPMHAVERVGGDARRDGAAAWRRADTGCSSPVPVMITTRLSRSRATSANASGSSPCGPRPTATNRCRYGTASPGCRARAACGYTSISSRSRRTGSSRCPSVIRVRLPDTRVPRCRCTALSFPPPTRRR